MSRVLALALSAAVLLSAPLAIAEEEEGDDWDGDYAKAAEHRADFMAGLGVGLAAGSTVGYPNSVSKIDEPEYRASTGFGFGNSLDLWLGGALQDWFVFGLGISGGGVVGHGLQAETGVFIVRIETYPFFYHGSFGQDFGLMADFGVGGVKVKDQDTTKEVADGGLVSVVGLGAVYEAWHFGSFAAGPTVQYRHIFSPSLSQHTATAGIRLVFYSGP